VFEARLVVRQMLGMHSPHECLRMRESQAKDGKLFEFLWSFVSFEWLCFSIKDYYGITILNNEQDLLGGS
jgi:hypothetical protein